MIGLDTNVLVRYFTQDDPDQAEKATTLIESLTTEQPGFITQIVLVELTWVLTGAYGINRKEITNLIETILRTKEFTIEAAQTVWKALYLYTGSTADFADCLIERLGREAKCEYTATFDIKAAKTAGMKLLL